MTWIGAMARVCVFFTVLYLIVSFYVWFKEDAPDWVKTAYALVLLIVLTTTMVWVVANAG